MVFLDLGAQLSGYCADMSRCTYIGKPSGSDARDLLEVGLEIYHAGLDAIGPGKPIAGVAALIEKRLAGRRWAEYFYPEGYGHGVGLDLFEGPGGLFNGSRLDFAPGMTIAYEPMVVVEGLGTGVVEDTLLVTEAGVENLCRFRTRTWN
jgi:Xaa-Pro aminopeptidase